MVHLFFLFLNFLLDTVRNEASSHFGGKFMHTRKLTLSA